MGSRMSRVHFRGYVITFVFILLGLIITAAAASAQVPPSGSSSKMTSPVPKTVAIQPQAAGSDGRTARLSSYEGRVYHLDLGKIGLRPLQVPPAGDETGLPQPLNGGAIGTGLAYMDIEPSVLTLNASGVILSSGWNPGETITLTINGASVQYTADLNGRLFLITGEGAAGYYLITEQGGTSGRQAGGIFYVSSSPSQGTGLAVVPHAINPNGSNRFLLGGSGFPPNSPITIERNGVAVGSTTSDGNGLFSANIAPSAGGDSGAVYTAVASSGGLMAGQSVEERADAGTGDQNSTRGFMARALVNSTTSVLLWEGEGFVPGETVNFVYNGGVVTSAQANSDGGVVYLIYTNAFGSAVVHLEGTVSGRRAWLAGRADTRAGTVPSLIVVPGQVWGNGSAEAWYTQFTPNQSATMYVDGVSIGSAGIDAGGNGYGFPPNPTSGLVHYVALVAANGQVAVAPFISLVPASTATPTSTPTVTSTPCTVITLFNEDFESGTLGQFVSSVPTCVPGNCGWVPSAGTAHSGNYSAFAPDGANISDQRLTTTSPIMVPASYSNVYLDFWHTYDFESGYDGGVLEFSTDGGATFNDALAVTNFLQGGYVGTISSSFGNPLSGRNAWTGTINTWNEVKVNLQPFAGQTVIFRFREGTDDSNGTTGWHIDDVRVMGEAPSCGSATPTATATVSATATATSTPVAVQIVGHVNWQGRGNQPDPRQMMPISLTLRSTTGGTYTDYSWQVTDAGGYFTVTTTLSSGAYNWRVKGPTYLANSGTFTLTQGTNNIEMGLMRTGDLDGNNVVNTTDFTLLKNNFGQGGAPPINP